MENINIKKTIFVYKPRQDLELADLIHRKTKRSVGIKVANVLNAAFKRESIYATI